MSYVMYDETDNQVAENSDDYALVIEAAVAQNVREQRDSLLRGSDWVVTKSTETGTPVPTEWSTYRQSLRDITNQAGFPTSVIFPDKPEA